MEPRSWELTSYVRRVWLAGWLAGRLVQVLRVLQLNALQDRMVGSRADWDAAVTLMETALHEKLAHTQGQLKELTGEDYLISCRLKCFVQLVVV